MLYRNLQLGDLLADGVTGGIGLTFTTALATSREMDPCDDEVVFDIRLRWA